VRITSPSDLLHYGIGSHYIPTDQLQVSVCFRKDAPGPFRASASLRACRYSSASTPNASAAAKARVTIKHALHQLLSIPSNHKTTTFDLPVAVPWWAMVPQAFKDELASNPSSLQQLLQQYSQTPPDSPGPLQRLMQVVGPHMGQLVASYHSAGCEELQAIHKLVHQLQQVRTIVVFLDTTGVWLAGWVRAGVCWFLKERH
jgi:hypothetical protein